MNKYVRSDSTKSADGTRNNQRHLQAAGRQLSIGGIGSFSQDDVLSSINEEQQKKKLASLSVDLEEPEAKSRHSSLVAPDEDTSASSDNIQYTNIAPKKVTAHLPPLPPIPSDANKTQYSTMKFEDPEKTTPSSPHDSPATVQYTAMGFPPSSSSV